jgi:Ca-activated chloride channel homolog
MMPLAFARPWWLLALPLLALLAWQLWRAPSRAAWTDVVDAHLLPHLLAQGSRRRIGAAALALALLLGVTALAGPVLPNAEHIYRRDAVRVLVVELSPRMAPHLERAKANLLALLRTLPAGDTALIVYAEEPYLVVPPTADVDTIARFVPELAIEAMPAAGNRPERALAMARDLFERNPAGARDLLWIAADAQLPAIALDGVRVSIVNGAQDNGEWRRPDERGGWIAAMSHTGGGADIGYWLLPALLPLAALAFRKGVLMLAAPLLCAGLLAPSPAEASALADYTAARLFAAGEHEAAAARFDDARWRALAYYRAGRYEDAARALEGRNDADSLYNRGNALARQGRLADALASYEAALKLRQNDADTLHNRDLVRRLLNQRNGAGGSRPPPPAGQREREAERIAEQWLAGVPDQPQTLLRRKLALEHQRRVAGKAERPW